MPFRQNATADNAVRISGSFWEIALFDIQRKRLRGLEARV